MPLAAILPGRAYPATAPLLALATDVLERHGYEVRAAAWELDELPDDPASWVAARLEELVPDGCDLVVGKSLGTRAGAVVAERAWPAVWLTPVLTDPVCAAGIRANPAPQLVIAGTEDPMYDAAVAGGLGCEVVEVAGADHALSHGEGVVLRDPTQRLVAAAFQAFLTVLP